MNTTHPDFMAPVHSPFPYPPTNVILIQETAEQGKVWWTEPTSDKPHTPFPALPLTINDLLNTEWINVHIGAVYKITEFKTYNGHLYPATPLNESSTITTTFGVWYADHFTIPTCVQYDPLTASEKLNWLLVRITYITKHLDIAQNEATRKPKANTSEIIRLRQNLATEIARIKAFVQHQQLPIPLELHVIEGRYLTAENQLALAQAENAFNTSVPQIPSTSPNRRLQIQSQEGFVMTTANPDSAKPFDIHNKIYSPYPSDLDPQSIKTKWFAPRAGTKQVECEGDGTNPAYIWSDTNRFPALPYTMSDLIGSVWISPFDGHTETITGIVVYGEEPFLQTDVEIEPSKFATLGRWINPERYAIDAVRYDTLTASNQLGWLLIAYEYTTTMLKAAATSPEAPTEDMPEHIRQSVPYQTLQATKLAQYQNAQLRQVIAIKRFAQINNLPVPAALLDSETTSVTIPAGLIEASTSNNEPEATTPVIPTGADPAALATPTAASTQTSTSEASEPITTTSDPGATTNEPEATTPIIPVSTDAAALAIPTPNTAQASTLEASELVTTGDPGAPKDELETAAPAILVSTDPATPAIPTPNTAPASTSESGETTATSDPDTTKDEPEAAVPMISISPDPAALAGPTVASTQASTSEVSGSVTVTNDPGAAKNGSEAADPVIQDSTELAALATPTASTQASTSEPSEPVTTTSDSGKTKDKLEAVDLSIPVSPDPAVLATPTASTSTSTSKPGATKNGSEAAVPMISISPDPAALAGPTVASTQASTSEPSEPVTTTSDPGATKNGSELADPVIPTSPDPKYDYSATIYARQSEPDTDPEALLAAYKKEVEAQKAASNPFKANKAIPATLYTFQELLGSTWVSLQTAKRETVVAVIPIKTGSPQSRNKVSLLTEDGGAQYPTIGMYDNGRYVIATHVRYDHLTTTAKHKWHLESLKDIRQQLSQVYYNQLTLTGDQEKGNDPRQALVTELEQELASEIKFAQAFAEQNNQSVPADLIAPTATLLADATQKANAAKQAQVTIQRPNVPASASTTSAITQPKPTRVSTRPAPPPPPDSEKEMLVCSPFVDLPPLPHVLTDSLRAAQHEQINLNKTGQQSQSPLVNRDLYPSTPWTLQQLVGSTWVNLYTGHKVTVKGLYIVYGHYHLTTDDVTENEWAITRPFGAYHHKTQRYYVEHWVRIDALLPTTAIEWEAQLLRHAASKCQQTEGEITTLQSAASKPSNWRSQLTTKKRDLERYMQEASDAAKHLQNYALQNMILVPEDITEQNLIAHYTTKKSRAKSAASAPKPTPTPVSEPTETAQRPTSAVSNTTPKSQPTGTTKPTPTPMPKPQSEEKVSAGQLAMF